MDTDRFDFESVSEALEGDDSSVVGASEEPEGDDLFGDDMLAEGMGDQDDFVEGDDVYDPNLMDDAEQREANPDQRRRAEDAMRRRERAEGGAEPRPARHYASLHHLLASDDDEAEGGAAETRRTRRRHWRQTLRERRTDLAPGADEVSTALEEIPFRGPTTPWDSHYVPVFEIVLSDFLWRYVDSAVRAEAVGDGDEVVGIYLEAINRLVRRDAASLTVNWDHLASYSGKVLEWVSYQPLEVMGVFNAVLGIIVNGLYPGLYTGRALNVRLGGFSSFVEPITTLSVTNLGQLVSVEGVVLRRSVAVPRVEQLFLECRNCGTIDGPINARTDQDWSKALRSDKRICKDHVCASNGPFIMNRERTVYRTVQYLTIQELPSAVQPGKAPRQKDVLVDGDIVDSCRPGDDVHVLALYRTKRSQESAIRAGWPVQSTELVANNVLRRADQRMDEITAEDIDIFKQLASQPNIREKIIQSVAPSIFGHRHVKAGLTMAMFGGVRRQHGNHAIRGDINVLLLGDPGMAKSQFLKYVHGTVEKSVFTSGKGASAAGLTAAMKKDPSTGEYSLEGGALVLSDTGICLIDEFDKMSEMDRVSIHEAMEAQNISISKAGICTTLRARCAVIAAANPVFGNYDPSLAFIENVTLGDTIVSRFDVLAVMRDQPSLTHDRLMAEFVLSAHFDIHPDSVYERRIGLNQGVRNVANTNTDDWLEGNGVIPQEVLRKFIMYARKTCHPTIKEGDENRVSDFYAQMRQASKNTGGIPLTVRHLESILRMACANAKMCLSPVVSRTDIDFAIGTMLESFIQSQKHAVAANLSRRFGKYRALACSPAELMEKVITEALNKRTSDLLLANMRDEGRLGVSQAVRGADGDAVDLENLRVPQEEITMLCQANYGLPTHIVERFLNSERFSQKFKLRSVDGDPCVFQVSSTQNEEVNLDYVN